MKNAFYNVKIEIFVTLSLCVLKCPSYLKWVQEARLLLINNKLPKLCLMGIKYSACRSV